MVRRFYFWNNSLFRPWDNGIFINCSIPSRVSDTLISYRPRAHVQGRFC